MSVKNTSFYVVNTDYDDISYTNGLFDTKEEAEKFIQEAKGNQPRIREHSIVVEMKVTPPKDRISFKALGSIYLISVQHNSRCVRFSTLPGGQKTQ